MRMTTTSSRPRGKDRRERLQDDRGLCRQSLPGRGKPSGHFAPRGDTLHSIQVELASPVDLWPEIRALDSHAPFLQLAPRRIPGALPQALECRNHLQHDQGKVLTKTS